MGSPVCLGSVDQKSIQPWLSKSVIGTTPVPALWLSCTLCLLPTDGVWLLSPSGRVRQPPPVYGYQPAPPAYAVPQYPPPPAADGNYPSAEGNYGVYPPANGDYPPAEGDYGDYPADGS